MDVKVEHFYRQIFTDLSVSPEEASELSTFFSALNPPPDKLVWLRATAFRIATSFLSDDGDNDHDIKLLRAINAIVHVLEKSCMIPKVPDGNWEFNNEKVEEFYQGILSNGSVDEEENEELISFFQENIPSTEHLVTMRAAVFKVASECLKDDKESNIALLRSTNVIVHDFELSCFKPKEYALQNSFDLDVNLSDAIQEMWNLDANRLTPNSDYTINVQEGKKPFWKEDKAADPLFTSVSRECFNRPTYKYFVALLDNYTSQTGKEETHSHNEREEVKSFLKSIMQTAPMQYCHEYLCFKKGGEIPTSPTEFEKLLTKIWFDFYRRDVEKDSSGFEHVFVGEVKDEKVSGMHNWIQFYFEEKKGNLDYRGYIKPRGHSDAETNSDDHVLTLQFDWNGVEKFVGTSFIGTSPEFEMAIYTTCFLLGEEDNSISLDTGSDTFDLNIRCYKIAGDKIGTAFPEATSHYEDA